MDVKLPDGTVISNVPDDISKAELTDRLARNGYDVSRLSAPSEPFGQRMNREIADIPRQVGLTARHGLNAVGGLVGMFSDPIAGVINTAIPSAHLLTARSLTNQAADYLGLPAPQNATERIVGDAAELMGSSAGMSGLASKAANVVTGLPKTVMQSIAANPLQQVVSGGAAGGAGGYTRETGGNAASQFAASLAAGIGAPMAMNTIQRAGTAATNAVRNRLNPQQLNAQIDVTINNALKDSGYTLADIPANVRNSIRSDVQQALNMNGPLSPDAIRRLADYRLTGATPRVGNLTLDPVTLTQEKNLAKAGANSKDPAAQQLAQAENTNNRQLIANLNDLGAGKAPGQFATGQTLRDTLSQYAAGKQGEITGLYNAAKDSQGRAAALDPQAFATTANNLLDYNLKGAFVPEQIRNMMNDFASGKIPLNVHTAEQFKTIIGNAQHGASDGNVRAALGFIRQALDNAPLIADTAVPPAAVNGGFQLKPVGGVSTELRPNLGQEAVDAFNAARSANRKFMQQVEGTPALAAAMDNAAPDAFFQQHVLNSTARDLRAMLDVVGGSPAGMNALKSEVVNWLKAKALNGAADEVGNFSQSAYNKALKQIGDQKLSMLFTPEEINQVKAVGRVASYEQVQPRGSAVNNSNTTPALMGMLDRVANSSLLSKIPLGGYISGPAENISIGIRANDAMAAPRGLLAPQINVPTEPAGLLMSPAVFGQYDDGKKKTKGLLSP